MKKILDDLRTIKPIALIAAAVVLGVAVGYGLHGDGDAGRQPQSVQADLSTGAAAGSPPLSDQHNHIGQGHAAFDLTETASATLYVCPMNCVPPMEKPGRCPVCGMELVPMETHEHRQADLPPRLVLPEAAVKASGIQTAAVEEKFVDVTIRLFGKIEYDPVEQYQVTAFAPGVIDNIFVKRAGQAVRRGDPLFDLHSSELFFLEQELFALFDKLPYKIDLRPAKGHGRKRIGRWTRLLLPNKPGQEAGMSAEEEKEFMRELDEIKRKLRLLGLSDEDVEEAIVRGRPTGISTVTTPMTGIVLKQNAFRGAYVNTGDVVFTIANPRVLWARLDAYASDFPWIRLGQEAEFETDAYPGLTFTGKVVFIDPEFDPDKRVFKVGVLFRDEKGLLKPNMLVRAGIRARMTAGGRGTVELVTQGMMGTPQTKRTDQPPLVIPENAPLITGKRAVVYVEIPGKPGVFEGREVLLGPRAEGYYIVRDGLEKGERVVVNGNFKIDSAVQILARSSMMSHGGDELTSDLYQHVATPPMPEMPKPSQHHRGARFDFHTGRDPKQNREAPSMPMAEEPQADQDSQGMQTEGHAGHGHNMK